MDAASIEQINKVRASVGLPLLPVPGKVPSGPQFRDGADESDEEDDDDEISTYDKRQGAAANNWQRLENERLDKLERNRRKDVVKKARDAAQRHSKLEGRGLGDADEEETDTRTWLLQQKKRQKKIENRRDMEAELEEQRQQQMQVEYTSKDLAGVKVAHEMDDFDEITGEKILTLKDTEIGDNSEDDELENADLIAKGKLEERLQSKKKRADYDPTEQEEPTGILSKYDEEIDGKKTKRFVLDGQGTSAKARQEKQSRSNENGTAKGIKISLDLLQDDQPANDYLDAAPIKVKKSKKKKSDKKSRVKEADEDDIPLPSSKLDPAAMDIDDKPKSRKRPLDVDDDHLQAQLAAQRMNALKKRKKMDAAEIARQMHEEMPVDDMELEEGGLILDETIDFVANIKKPELVDPSQQTSRRRETEVEQRDELDDDLDMADVDGDRHQNGQSPAPEKANASAPTNATATGLEDEEGTSGIGLGSSVALLRKRGLISNDTSDELTEKARQRNNFLAEKQKLTNEFDQRAKGERDALRRTARWEKMSNRERETYAQQQNEGRERFIAKLEADLFNKQYKPDIKLEYHDEFGRSMSQKEAFKHLSHSFHGKGSGKQKTEKHLQHIQNEKKQMSKSILNVNEDGGMLNVQGREGKRTKQAGVRLQ